MTTALKTENDELREKVCDAARRYKASWIELGQFLFAIYKDKHYRSWGHLSFEAYCLKELGVKQTTAGKLLKSYDFLEKEEPRFVEQQFKEEENPKKVPNYESVNLLRLAKDNQKLTPHDYAQIRESVLVSAKEPKEVRAEVTKLLSQRENKDPSVVRSERRNAAIKRLVSLLANTRRELENENLLPDYLLKQMGDLVLKLQDQIEE